jgi:hypothetical protein
MKVRARRLRASALRRMFLQPSAAAGTLRVDIVVTDENLHAASLQSNG